MYVTGTFDDWSKSVKLEKKGTNIHEKLVELPRADQKIYYKVGSPYFVRIGPLSSQSDRVLVSFTPTPSLLQLPSSRVTLLCPRLGCTFPTGLVKRDAPFPRVSQKRELRAMEVRANSEELL